MFPFGVATMSLGASEILILVLILAVAGGIAWAVARSVTRKKDDE